MKKFINKLFGDPNAKAIKKILPLVEEIKKIEATLLQTVKTQNDVLAKTSEFKDRIKNGESLEKILPEAFALVKIACHHLNGKSFEVRGRELIWDMIPYDVQLIGGIVLHQGNISEMKTGEGKTLVCTMPVYLNALTEKGVFVVTVNDYLAHRDAEWMGVLYNYLGLSVGVTIHGMNETEKKHAYSCDITYGTNNEFGFDYLRDNMATHIDQVVQRHLHYAIVDEVDSILIDEARTPLIISAPAGESTDKYKKYSQLIRSLKEGAHFEIDEKSKTATLTEAGISKMEQLMGVENIYTEAGFSEVHHIEQALRAETCYKADIDYIVQEDEIIIIDEFTGRLMQGRRYSHGLHQAIEAKENVAIKNESKTLATVSFQNYFRLFEKLAGMTGTAETEAEEFYQIYGLDTIIIPTNRPITRIDRADTIYKNRKGKYLAAVKLIKELHQKGQPVLVGTISVEQSEMLSQLLKLEGIKHEVLNAKNHQREAEIVTNAGQKGAVTIATNMAGRGTDIKLGEGVKEVGGLYVLGTERHESRRIDNQLRGRSGRQGDQGASQFLVSMEDDLMRLFGGEKILSLMEMLKVPEDMPIENGIISRSIENAQKKVEGRNFDVRKHLVEYDDIMNIHRNIIYKKRLEVLTKDSIADEIEETIKELATMIVQNHIGGLTPNEWKIEKMAESLNAIHRDSENPLTSNTFKDIKESDKVIEIAEAYLLDCYKKKEQIVEDPAIMRNLEKAIYLRTNDMLWIEHIDAMSRLRENVAFSGYAQKDPLTEYKSQAFHMFNELNNMVRVNTVTTLFRVDIQKTAPSQLTKKAETENQQEAKKSEIAKLDLKNTKVDRNDPCPCGSGKKYKKCHGA